MYAHVLPYLNPKIVFNERTDFWFDKFGKDALYFQLGRDALYWGVKSLGLKPGDAILMPASMCEVVLQPFLNLGIEIIYYDINEAALFDYDQIALKITGKVKALYITHYYGFPQSPDATKIFCREHNIFFIEDCAHALLGSYKGTPLGEFGDISIFSFRKFLPLWSGSVLKINNDNVRPLPLDQPTVAIDFTQAIKYLLKGILEGSRILNLLKYAKEYPVWHDEVSEDYMFLPNRPSSLFLKLLTYLNPGHISERRRQNFQYYLDFLKQEKVKTLYTSLPEGVVPYSCPILVDDPEVLYKLVSSKGVLLEPTHNYTFKSILKNTDQIEKFEGTNAIASQLLSMPVHQNLNENHIKKIINSLKYGTEKAG